MDSIIIKIFANVSSSKTILREYMIKEGLLDFLMFCLDHQEKNFYLDVIWTMANLFCSVNILQFFLKK